MLDAQIAAIIDELKDADFDGMLKWAAREIKPQDPLEETVAKLHFFSLAEPHSRPSFLSIDAQSTGFYERRMASVKLHFLIRNAEFASFIQGSEKPAKGESKDIARLVSGFYVQLLTMGESFAGTYLAATPNFRRNYLGHFVTNQTNPGWHFYNLMLRLSSTSDLALVAALMVPTNLMTFFRLDFDAEIIDKRYEGSLRASKYDPIVLTMDEKARNDPDIKKHRETGLSQIKERVRGYEISKERHQRAGRQLANTLFDSSDKSAWRRLLLHEDGFSIVANNCGIHGYGPHAAKKNYDPEAQIQRIREIAQRTYDGSLNFLGGFDKDMKVSRRVPAKYGEALRELTYHGLREMPRLFYVFERQVWAHKRKGSSMTSDEEHLLEHWYDQIVLGNLSPKEARAIPGKFYSLRTRLAQTIYGSAHDFSEREVQKAYGYVLVSRHMLDHPELALAIAGTGADLNEDNATSLLGMGYSHDELIRRLGIIRSWSEGKNIILTPSLVDYLVRHSDVENSMATLEGLLARTESGNFNFGNDLQRELEFQRYVAIRKERAQGNAPARVQLYAKFKGLGELPELENEFSLNFEEIGAIERAAFEAAQFGLFVSELRKVSSRNIYIIGNITYGQSFVVLPLEDYLDANVRTGYHRVSSSDTQRHDVADVFSVDFVREMSDTMPHLVIVDNGGHSGRPNRTRFSRATLGYANWFAVFNDLRADGDIARYRKESSLTGSHLRKLKGSLGFSKMRENLGQLVREGDVYNVVQWAPHLEKRVAYGGVLANRQPLDYSDDRPLAVLANPIVYKEWVQGMNPALKGTVPNFWDDPEEHASIREVIGFGSFGVESRTDGRNRDQLVEIVRQKISERIGKYLRDLQIRTLP